MPPSSIPVLTTLCNILNSPAHFLTIPVEIRNLIYTYVLEDEHEYPVPITTARSAEEDEADPECVIRGPYALPRVHGSTLLRVNRQVHDEVRDLMSRKRRLCHDGTSKREIGTTNHDHGNRMTTYKCELTLQNEAYYYPVWTSIPSFLPFQLQSAPPSTAPSTSTAPKESVSLDTLPALTLTLHIRGDNQQRLPHSLMGGFYANGFDPPGPIWSLWLIIRDILTCGPPLQSNHKTTTKKSNGVRIQTLSLNVLTAPPAAVPAGLGVLPVEGFRELRGFRRAGVINPRTVAGQFVEYTEWLWEEGGYPDGDELGKLFVERLDGFRVCVDGVVVKEWDVKGIRARGRKRETRVDEGGTGCKH